jgi:hypothetical protein
MATRVVPFPRTLKLGVVGRDVVAVKRAWRKVPPPDTLISNRTRVYGPGAVRACKKFEKMKHIHIDGVYGLEAHLKLAPYFDAYGAWLMSQQKKMLEKPHPREQLVAAAMALRNYEIQTGRVGYTQGGMRMTIVRHHLHVSDYGGHPYIYEDCSSAVTGYFWQCHLPDPNGRGYDGEGFTGTLCQHGVPVASPLPGDLIFYGYGYPWKHVAIAVGDDPFKPATRCVSHGHQGGPVLSLIHYRSDVGQYRSYVSRS